MTCVTSCVDVQSLTERRMRMSFRRMTPRVKGNKYQAQKTIVDGITFDSKKEAHRYKELKLLERAGEISSLQLQTPYELQPSFKHNGKTIRAIKYVADFTYTDKAGKIHIEDTKGVKTKEYLIKKKMMLYKGHEIEEV